MTSFGCPINIAHSTAKPSLLCGSRWKTPGTNRTMVYWIHAAVVSRAQPLESAVVV